MNSPFRHLVFGTGVVAALMYLVFTPVLRAQGSWTQPVGVPRPSFGLTEVPPPVTHSIAPGQDLPATVPAGAHVRLLAGTHTQFVGDLWNLQGAVEAPVFVTAEPGAVIDCDSSDDGIRVRGQYAVLDGLRAVRTRMNLGSEGKPNAHHIAIRDYEESGLEEDANGTAISVRAAKDVLILRAHIHDNGTPSGNEPGMNGITASGVDDQGVPAQRLWVVDGRFYRNRGDHVRIGRPTAGSNGLDVPRFIYIARNEMWEDPTRPDNAIGENAIDIKTSADVVISQNVAHGFRATPTSPAECIVVHDRTTRVWVLQNDLSRCGQAVSVTSGTAVRILGNFAHDLSERAFRVTPDVVLAHNTIRRSPIGVYASRSPGVVLGNLLHQTQRPFSFGSGGTVKKNITGGNPLFVNATSMALQAKSSARDAASEGPAYEEFQALYGLDIRGGRPAGAAWDVGAYEIPEASPSPPPTPAPTPEPTPTP